jgi:hypothetical protein
MFLIEIALDDVKKFNENDEEILREIIYGNNNLLKSTIPPNELKESIQSALDTFFSNPNVDDVQTFDILLTRNKPQI